MKKLKLVSVLVMVLFAVNALSAQEEGEYYFSKTVKGSFEKLTKKVKDELKKQDFGVITEIDMDAKLKEKLDDVDLLPYKILGVCNPAYAWQTIKAEENIGLFLPCKVLIKDMGDGTIEVVMVNPSALMQMLGNKDLDEIAAKVTDKFKAALEKIE